MNAETVRPDALATLRKPFPAENIAKLPKVNCRNCTAQKRACGENNHRMVKCDVCGNWITSAHIHLDYVGHAEATDRLLDADPAWYWEPMAMTPEGLPQFDGEGGLWIRLTVAGVTRLGYGSADGKKGPNAIKEIIGDAIRNAGMRFGMALDLWAKTDLHADEREEEPAEEPERPAQRERGRAEDEWSNAAPARPEQTNEIVRLFGIVRSVTDAGTMRQQIGAIIGNQIASARELTTVQADSVLDVLRAEGRQQPPVVTPLSPTPDDPELPAGKSRAMHALFREKGIETSEAKHEFIRRVLGYDIDTMAAITRSQGEAVIRALTTGEVPVHAPLPDGIAPSDEGFDEFAALTQMIHDVHDEQSFVEAQKAIDTERAAGSIDDDDVRLLRERLAEQAKAIPAGAAA